MKILVTGGSGLFGGKFTALCQEKHFEVYGTFCNQRVVKDNFLQLDITKREAVFDMMTSIEPDVVVHAAAYTDVDGCEQHQQRAFAVNVLGTQYIAETVEHCGAQLVYVSTDYVFDGSKGWYSEEDITHPINYYGLTKLKGEEQVKNLCSKYIIARTSVLYGHQSPNFATWLLAQLKEKKPVSIVVDQFVSPTLHTDLAEQILALIDKNAQGLFHTAGGERVSRYKFATMLAHVFEYDNSLIHSITMDDIQWRAQRPKDSSLDTSKITEIKKPYKVREAVELLQEDMER
jgi:dTDP-4-dehydrorhamnose reductase